jgi:hypothetical protein
MTANTQARVWQHANATTYTAAKHMLFLPTHDYNGTFTFFSTRKIEIFAIVMLLCNIL